MSQNRRRWWRWWWCIFQPPEVVRLMSCLGYIISTLPFHETLTFLSETLSPHLDELRNLAAAGDVSRRTIWLQIQLASHFTPCPFVFLSVHLVVLLVPHLLPQSDIVTLPLLALDSRKDFPWLWNRLPLALERTSLDSGTEFHGTCDVSFLPLLCICFVSDWRLFYSVVVLHSISSEVLLVSFLVEVLYKFLAAMIPSASFEPKNV